MCVRRANSKAKSPTCPSIRRKACCAAATFPARQHAVEDGGEGGQHLQNAPKNCAKSTSKARPVKPGKETVVYCRIGERSSHTWFVLTYLFGLDNVRNYDGSWTEWGNRVGAPIEKGS